MGTHFAKIPNGNPLVRAIHTAVKGRARYKVNGLAHSEALKRYLEFRLSEEEGIAQVRASRLTGNVLVIFHPDFTPYAIALLIQGIVLDYRQQTRKPPVRTAYISTAAQKQKNSPWHLLAANSVSNEFNTSSVTGLSSASANSKEIGNTQTLNGEAIMPKTPKQKQLEQVDNQFVLVSGAVCTLVIFTGVLHRYGLDTVILLAIQKLHTPLLDRIMLGITFFGDPVTLLLICLALGIGQRYYNRRAEATTLGIAAVGAIGLNYWLKVLFARARPALWEWIVDVGHHSFPSGHAMGSMAIYGFLGYILAKQFPQRRGQILAFTVVLIVAIGFSRLYLGVHWPTDVAAGYAAGLVWLIACILSLKLWQKYYSSNSLPHALEGI